MSTTASTTDSWPEFVPGGEAIPLHDAPGTPDSSPDLLPQVEAADEETEEFDDDDFDDDFDDNFEDELEDDFEDEFGDVSESELEEGEFAPDGEDDEDAGPVEFEEDEDF
jgi:hypothetical protein